MMEKRIRNLILYCQGLYNKENGKILYEKYLEDIENVEPQDIFMVMYELLEKGILPRQILRFVDKIINVFYKNLHSYNWERPKEDTFLYYLIMENNALKNEMTKYKEVIKRNDFEEIMTKGLDFIDILNQYNEHLSKLENILFPYMGKKNSKYDGLKIMWELHLNTRVDLKSLEVLFKNENTTNAEIKKALGNIYFKLLGLIQKQELILFPAATKLMSEDDFVDMHFQSFDYKFPLIKRPQKPEIKLEVIAPNIDSNTVFKTETGSLSYHQLELLINALPVDVTFVNENDKVAFFSRPKDRIFPRSVAVIGQDVRNCHPPKSVHIVEEIIASFRDGSKDSETFWLKLKGMFVMIQYFALRDEDGKYKGTLEVSQEISEIRSLEGEKRLLD